MRSMKAFTDINQSKKLAEILSPESADMIYYWFGNFELNDEWYELHFGTNKVNDKDIYAWSLAALVSILPVSCDDGQHCFALINCNPNGDTEWLCCYEDDNGNLLNECYADNPIDACVEMVLKLDEQKLL